jgi:uncharacterized phiE125 gp8 family phage protein
MIRIDPLALPDGAVAELKSHLRIEQDEDDSQLAGFLATAIEQGEAFTRQLFIERRVVDRMPVSSAWQRLHASPVRSILQVQAIRFAQSPVALLPDAYALDIDAMGEGWTRMVQSTDARQIDVEFRAGIASDWASLPETLRMGVIRLAAHLYTVRDDPSDAGPPALVAAFWLPWRRLRLS